MSSFGSHLRERRAEVEVAASGSHPRLVVPLPLLASRLLLRVVAARPRTARCRPRPLRPLLLRRDVRGDLLHEAIREPLRVGDVAVIAAVHPAEFEEAAEGARRVGVVVAEGEALALASLLPLAGLPVVLGGVLDLRERAEGRVHRLGVRAELREQRRDGLLAGARPREDRPAVAADAVGDGMERLPVVVEPLGREHVVHDLAGGGREARRVLRALREPCGREVGEQRLALRDLDEARSAGERYSAGGEQVLRPLRQPQEVEALAHQPLALADELGHLRRVAVLVDEAAVRACLLERAEVGADHVLCDRERERLALDLAHLGGDLAELRRLRRPVAALPGDDRVAAVAVPREGQRRDDPVALHGLDELGHPLVVELGARVRLARADLRDRNHAQRRGHDCEPPSVRRASARSLSAAGSVARSNRASWWLRPAVARVGWT